MPDLKRYREKRDPNATPEPFGGDVEARAIAPGAARAFVVQQHAARNMHWDFRIEIDGVLVSFAIPKGPTLDPKEKRFAAQTEDHPLEYGDFEGIIPKGNYGAGPMILWDRGSYHTVEGTSPAEGLAAGKLDLLLEGHKLRGRFALVRMKGEGGKSWLWLAKVKGADLSRELVDAEPASVASGLTIEELRAQVSRSAEVVELARAAKAPRARAAEGRARADARRDDRARVHARGLAVRAQVRRRARGGGEAGRRHGEARRAQRARRDRGVSGDHPRRPSPAGVGVRDRRRGRRARRERAGFVRAPDAPLPRRAGAARRGRLPGRLLRLRRAVRRGPRPARAAARDAQGDPRALRAAARVRALRRSRGRRGRGAARGRARARARGHRRQARRLEVRERPAHEELAEDQAAAHRSFWRSWATCRARACAARSARCCSAGACRESSCSRARPAPA